MPSHTALAIASLLIVLLVMLGEARHSRRHEAALRSRGAVEPPGDVYRTMQWAYPLAFVAMAAEGAIAGPAPGAATTAGAVTWVAAKALKFWAIAALGERWTFRVLVLPGAPLVTTGPYAMLRHPNYVAVLGELAGMALLVGARVTGPAGTLLFGWVMWQRIRIEDRALRHPPCT